MLAVALHDGHLLRDECAALMALSREERLREEDPYTGGWAELFETHAVISQSRFEVDLNRPRSRAIYRSPEDAWGLQVWKEELPEDVAERSLMFYDAFYRESTLLLMDLLKTVDRIVVLDLHAYNHRRAGCNAPPEDPVANPQINIGTGSMDRRFWAPVVDRFESDLKAFDFPGGPLDVRENIRFRGGYFSEFIHQAFPETVCVLSAEVRKSFMDEWTGVLDPEIYCAVGCAFEHSVVGLTDVLEHMSRCRNCR